MDLELSGRRAIVTGGSRGIGLAAARALGEEGAELVLAARDPQALGRARASLTVELGRPVVTLEVDTGSGESVRRMIDTAVRELGGVEILVNAAARPGGQSAAPGLAGLDGRDAWEDFNVKVLGYLRCMQAVAPLMVAQRFGRIINISGLAARSTGSIVGSIRNVAVAAAAKNVADELAGTGVTVTTVHPGMTRTESTPRVIAARAAAGGIGEDEVEAQLGARNGLGRIIDAREIGWLVAFLASPKAAAVAGDAIAAGGGTVGPIHY